MQTSGGSGGSKALLRSPQGWSCSVESNQQPPSHKFTPVASGLWAFPASCWKRRPVCLTELEFKHHTGAGSRCATFAPSSSPNDPPPSSSYLFVWLRRRARAPLSTIRQRQEFSLQEMKNAILLEFTTTNVCKIEFLRPHFGAGFSISQVLLLLA